MDDDLRDVLAGCLGAGELTPEREAELVARLNADAEFRRAVADELRLLGLLKVAQSAEPRWLRLADAMGVSAAAPASDNALAESVVREAMARDRRRWNTRLAGAALALAACLAVAAWVAWDRSRGPAGGSGIARVTELDSVVWGEGFPALAVGEAVPPGRLRLRSGRVALAFASGVALSVEGPADVEVVSRGLVVAHAGKVRVRGTPGVEGFTVKSAGLEVLDLGAEFGLNVGPGGKAQLMVFDGTVAVSALGQGEQSVQSALVQMAHAAEIDTVARTIRRFQGDPDSFARMSPRPMPDPSPLGLAASYREAVLAAGPWAYWRFESRRGDLIPNEVEGRPALRVAGGVTLGGRAGGNRWAEFHHAELRQSLLMDGVWTPPRDEGYAVELWAQPSALRANGHGKAALVSLIADRPGDIDLHISLLELTARSHEPADPCAARFLDRWPAGWNPNRGVNVFSRRNLIPGRWHHLVGQKNGGRLELYLDGELVASSPESIVAADGRPETEPCRLLVGRLKRWADEIHEIRPFTGRLDELAVYPRPLTAGEVREHAALRVAGKHPPTSPKR